MTTATLQHTTIPDAILERWQDIADLMAELVRVPVGLIMRRSGANIEVLVSSSTDGNPYHVGDKEHFEDSGLYCETVIKTGEKLLVPNALADPVWATNPDVKLDMISYLGYPIRWPDQTPFGTICVLDRQHNAYSVTFEKLVLQFRDLIEQHLAMVVADVQLRSEADAEHKRQIENLRQSEIRFRLLAEHAADDYLLHDESGLIVDANRQLCENLGLERDVLLTRNIESLPIEFHQQWNAEIWGKAGPGATIAIESRYWHADGVPYPVEIRLSCQVVSGRRVFLGLIHDITERVQAERSLRRAEAELARASRFTAVGNFAGSIVHEINQPLGAIITSGEACLRWLDRAEPEIEEARTAALRLVAAGRRATSVISGLRSYAQKASPELVMVDINDVIRDVMAMVEDDLSHGQVVVSLTLCPQDCRILGDHVQLQLVLINLIRNALDAMAKASGRERILEVRSKASLEEVLVSVCDTGTGLPNGIADRLFDPLFTTKATGMGMGLSISKSIVEGHRGTITAASRLEEKGACFSIVLPGAVYTLQKQAQVRGPAVEVLSASSSG
jgi:PAS domain S-box-containing protein